MGPREGGEKDPAGGGQKVTEKQETRGEKREWERGEENQRTEV